MKICPICNQEKEDRYFGQTICKQCKKLQDAERYRNNKEKLKTQSYERKQKYKNLIGVEIPSEKKCINCQVNKPINDFGINRSNKDQHQFNCKECINQSDREFRKNKVKIKKIHRNKFIDGKLRNNGVEKYCNGCKSFKLLDRFNKNKTSGDGLQSYCNDCVSLYWQQNKEKLLPQRLEKKNIIKNIPEEKTCKMCNSKKCSNMFWTSNYTSDGLYSTCKKCAMKQRESQKEQIKKYNSVWQKKTRKVPENRLRRNVSCTISEGLKRNNGSKRGESIIKYLPYTFQQLKSHLESLWEPWMNWSNYGKYDKNRQTWQIDHIIPQSKLLYCSMEDDNFKLCWALNNLRPLLALENIIKSNKVLNASSG